MAACRVAVAAAGGGAPREEDLDQGARHGERGEVGPPPEEPRAGWGSVRLRCPKPATARRPADESTSGPEGEDAHQGRESQVRDQTDRPQKPEGVVSKTRGRGLKNLRRSLTFSKGWPRIVERWCLKFLKGHR